MVLADVDTHTAAYHFGQAVGTIAFVGVILYLLVRLATGKRRKPAQQQPVQQGRFNATYWPPPAPTTPYLAVYPAGPVHPTTAASDVLPMAPTAPHQRFRLPTV